MVAISLTKEVYEQLSELGDPDQVIYVIVNLDPNVYDISKNIVSRGYGKTGHPNKETAKGYKIINVKNTTKAILDVIKNLHQCSYSSIVSAGLAYISKDLNIPVRCSEIAKGNQDVSHAVSDMVWTEGFEYNMYLYKHRYNLIPEKYLNVLREMVGGNYLSKVNTQK